MTIFDEQTWINRGQTYLTKKVKKLWCGSAGTKTVFSNNFV